MCPGNKMTIYTLLLSYIPFTIATPFQSFYPHYAQTLTNLSENVCSETLALMEGVNYSPDSAPPQADRLDYCYGHENCMLANLPAAYLANYQAASVIIGLTPTILASLGPSVAETSLLSAHRPLLSFLISLSAPAVYPARVFEFTDPYSVLGHKEHLLKAAAMGNKVGDHLQRTRVCLCLGCCYDYHLDVCAARGKNHSGIELYKPGSTTGLDVPVSRYTYRGRAQLPNLL